MASGATCPQGHPNPPGQKYCGTCGSSVESGAPSASPLHDVDVSPRVVIAVLGVVVALFIGWAIVSQVTKSSVEAAAPSTPVTAESTTTAALESNEVASTTVRGVSEAPVDRSIGASAAIMPDVVCMNLQDAQNRIQEEGVFFSRSHDATGRERNQVLDSNWIVVGQSPAAG